MKTLTWLSLTIALLSLLLPQDPVPAPPIVETEAKEELYEAARAYREGNCAEAQAHSERALLLDRQSRTALLCTKKSRTWLFSLRALRSSVASALKMGH
jgi:hypothetical protein